MTACFRWTSPMVWATRPGLTPRTVCPPASPPTTASATPPRW
ncbi:hypothetical protein ACFQ0H_07970 [Lysobacter gummosus]